MKILLINPRSGDDVFSNVVDDIPYLACMMKRRTHASFAPTALVTLAALTPPEHQITIHDEYVAGPVERILERKTFDLVGISTLANQLNRTLAIGRFCRDSRVPGILVVGGSGTMNMPQSIQHLFDVVFYGEAEDTWPQFLADLRNGERRSSYQQISKTDMSRSPIPRWGLIEKHFRSYGAVSVQTTRGCPYDCDFCDVIYIYGRQQRSKPIEQVLDEVRLLQSMGAKLILIADDNFGSNREYTKALLRKLVPLNNSFPVPMSYITQSDVRISEDEELLELMADCNFVEVLLGIEAVTADSLRAINKQQNLAVDLVAAVRKVQSYGIPVLGSMLIGTDADDASTFKRTEEFVKAAYILDHSCHPLMAPSGTRLWYRLKRQGRLVTLDDSVRDRLDIVTNIVPKNMTRAELMEGLADYADTVCHPLHYMQRAINFVRNVKRKPNVKKVPMRVFWPFRNMVARMFWYYTFEVSRDHRRAFYTILRTTMKEAPFLGPKMMFLHTAFTMMHKRAAVAANIAREHAAWEREHPELVRQVDPSLPIPETIREHSGEIFNLAYECVRPSITDREKLYAIVVESMQDYVDRFGNTCGAFDEIQKGHVRASCERTLARLDGAATGRDDNLPADHAPPGFARSILDALDHTIRAQQGTVSPSITRLEQHESCA